MLHPSTLSEVTPVKRSLKPYVLNRWTLGAATALLLFAAAFLPEHSTVREAAEEKDNGQKEFTLSQNLDFIAQMRKQQANADMALKLEPLNNLLKPGLSKETVARMNAPTTFFNASPSTHGETRATEGHALTGTNGNAQFLNQQDDIVSVSAKRLPHPAYTIPAGEMIPATLETAINPELAGMVRAITARDIYSLKDQHCLIPRGSELVGQFNSFLVEGQSRIFVVWNRVQLANGIIVTLNSPSTDSIGRSGQGADYINRHFFERFSTSALLSVLGATAANAGVNGKDEYNSSAEYRRLMASNLEQASSKSLKDNGDIGTTLQTNQGAKINIFVAHDLDFHNVRGSQ